MFKAIKTLVALLTLLSTAVVAYSELRKAWLAMKGLEQPRTTYRTSEYATGETGAPYSGYTS